MKKSIIKEITRQFDGRAEVLLENGDKGTIWKPIEKMPAIGQEFEYELIPSRNADYYLPTIKITVDAAKKAIKKQSIENIRFAISMAVNLKMAGKNYDANGKELTISESTDCFLKIIDSKLV